MRPAISISFQILKESNTLAVLQESWMLRGTNWLVRAEGEYTTKFMITDFLSPKAFTLLSMKEKLLGSKASK